MRIEYTKVRYDGGKEGSRYNVLIKINDVRVWGSWNETRWKYHDVANGWWSIAVYNSFDEAYEAGYGAG